MNILQSVNIVGSQYLAYSLLVIWLGGGGGGGRVKLNSSPKLKLFIKAKVADQI